MNFRRFRSSLIVAASLVASSALATAGTIVIDDLTKTSGHFAISNGTGTDTNLQTGINTANTIGGSRSLFLDVTSGSQLDTVAVNTTLQRLSLNLGSGDVGFGTVTYDANGSGLNAAFLSALGETANNIFFQANISFSDQNLGLVATFFDGTTTATYSTTLGSGVSFVNQSFASFTNGNTINWDSIQSISVKLDGPAAQDGTISFLEITTTPDTGTPEPATMAMLGSALVGLGLLGRKRFAR